MILVDSNIWIQAWRGEPAKISMHLADLVDRNQVCINTFIWVELLQGATSKKHQLQLKNLLDPIPHLPLDESLWTRSAEFFLEFKMRGVTPTTIDCFLATQCLVTKTPLWSQDHIFSKMAKIKDLKLHVP